jgi:hypothetical protein
MRIFFKLFNDFNKIRGRQKIKGQEILCYFVAITFQRNLFLPENLISPAGEYQDSATAERSATASGSAARASLGRARRPCHARPSGLIGRRCRR